MSKCAIDAGVMQANDTTEECHIIAEPIEFMEALVGWS